MASPKKCQLGGEEANYLGHTIQRKSVRPQQKELERMTYLPKPLIKRQLKSFLELVGYCRQVDHRDSECHGNAERDHPEGLWTISEGLVWGICGGVVAWWWNSSHSHNRLG